MDFENITEQIKSSFSQKFGPLGFQDWEDEITLKKETEFGKISIALLLDDYGDTFHLNFNCTWVNRELESYCENFFADSDTGFAKYALLNAYPSHFKGDDMFIYEIRSENDINASIEDYFNLYCGQIDSFIQRSSSLTDIDKLLNESPGEDLAFASRLPYRAVHGVLVRQMVNPASTGELIDTYRQLPSMERLRPRIKEPFDFVVAEIMKG